MKQLLSAGRFMRNFEPEVVTLARSLSFQKAFYSASETKVIIKIIFHSVQFVNTQTIHKLQYFIISGIL